MCGIIMNARIQIFSLNSSRKLISVGTTYKNEN